MPAHHSTDLEAIAAAAASRRIRRRKIVGALMLAGGFILTAILGYLIILDEFPSIPSASQQRSIVAGALLVGLSGNLLADLGAYLRKDSSGEAAAITAGYRERTQLLAYLTAHHTGAVLAEPGSDPNQPDYHVLYVPSPTGQLSWHIRPEHTHLLRHVERVAADDRRAEWDGHSTSEKHLRLEQLVDDLADDVPANRTQERS